MVKHSSSVRPMRYTVSHQHLCVAQAVGDAKPRQLCNITFIPALQASPCPALAMIAATQIQSQLLCSSSKSAHAVLSAPTHNPVCSPMPMCILFPFRLCTCVTNQRCKATHCYATVIAVRATSLQHVAPKRLSACTSGHSVLTRSFGVLNPAPGCHQAVQRLPPVRGARARSAHCCLHQSTCVQHSQLSRCCCAAGAWY